MNVFIIRSRFAYLSQSFGESYSVPNRAVLLDACSVIEWLEESGDPSSFVVEGWRVGGKEPLSSRGDKFIEEYLE